MSLTVKPPPSLLATITAPTPLDISRVFTSLSMSIPFPTALQNKDPAKADSLRRAAHVLYAQILAPYPRESVDRAAMIHLADGDQGRFWPSIAHLTAILERLHPELRPAPLPSSPDLDAAAWEHIEAQLTRSPADRSDAELAPHQRRAFYRVTGGFRRTRGGFGKDEANEARNMPFLKRRFLQICAESPATPEDLLPPPAPSPEQLANLAEWDALHARGLREREANLQESIRERAAAAQAAPGASARAPAPRKQPRRHQGPRMDEAEITRRMIQHGEFVARLDAERAAFTPCEGCIMPGSDDGAPDCRESSTCERDLRARRVTT